MASRILVLALLLSPADLAVRLKRGESSRVGGCDANTQQPGSYNVTHPPGLEIMNEDLSTIHKKKVPYYGTIQVTELKQLGSSVWAKISEHKSGKWLEGWVLLCKDDAWYATDKSPQEQRIEAAQKQLQLRLEVQENDKTHLANMEISYSTAVDELATKKEQLAKMRIAENKEVVFVNNKKAKPPATTLQAFGVEDWSKGDWIIGEVATVHTLRGDFFLYVTDGDVTDGDDNVRLAPKSAVYKSAVVPDDQGIYDVFLGTKQLPFLGMYWDVKDEKPRQPVSCGQYNVVETKWHHGTNNKLFGRVAGGAHDQRWILIAAEWADGAARYAMHVVPNDIDDLERKVGASKHQKAEAKKKLNVSTQMVETKAAEIMDLRNG